MEKKKEVNSYQITPLFTQKEVAERITALGKKIDESYKNSSNPIVLIGLLRGSFIFMADLCRAIESPHEVDFMTVSSYGSGTQSSREVKILKDLESNIEGKHVLIIEDIIDTGYTLNKVCEMLHLRQPASIQICTLLDKPTRREVEVNVNYVGFTVPDKFVVGYGIDYDQRHRHLPYVGVVMFD